MIIIIASELDSHADAVIIALRNSGFNEFLRIDFDSVHDRFDIISRPTKGDFELINKDSKKIVLRSSEVKTVWWRRATSYTNRLHLEIPTDSTLDRIESYWIVRWSMELLDESFFPFGHPYKMRDASNKIEQLRVASKCGFSAPATVLTNSHEGIRDFLSNHNDIVVKPLKTALVNDEKRGKEFALISKTISKYKLTRLLDSESSGFSLFCQERINKVSDIRLNSFPSSSIACKIDTSKLPVDIVDWRPNTMDFEHTIVDVPASIEKSCRSMLEHFGLRWGAFDFALTKEGEWIFLECNPNGQWLWIQLKTNYPLAEEVAFELIRHHKMDNTPNIN